MKLIFYLKYRIQCGSRILKNYRNLIPNNIIPNKLDQLRRLNDQDNGRIKDRTVGAVFGINKGFWSKDLVEFLPASETEAGTSENESGVTLTTPITIVGRGNSHLQSHALNCMPQYATGPLASRRNSMETKNRPRSGAGAG